MALKEWFTQQRLKNVPINGPLLIEKANQLATSLNISDFKCSNSWI
jgi:hypothetical protein